MAQVELAQRIGVRENSIGRIERGGFVPKTQRVIDLARELGVSVEWLLTGKAARSEPPPEPPPAGLGEYLESAEAGSLTTEERVALADIGRALERLGRLPTPYTYAAAVGLVRMTPMAEA